MTFRWCRYLETIPSVQQKAGEDKPDGIIDRPKSTTASIDPKLKLLAMKKLKDKRFDTLATNSAMAQSHEISRVDEEAEEKIIKE